MRRGVAEFDRWGIAEVPESRGIACRTGINTGDIVVEGHDIYGDGVNVAAGLEGLAEPGGTCASRNVYNQVKEKLDLTFEHLGEKQVKNIAEPVTVYGVRRESAGPGVGWLAKGDESMQGSRSRGSERCIPIQRNSAQTASAVSIPEPAEDSLALSIVIPTFNECQNISEIIRRIQQALNGVAWEAIFVDDDSPDGTADAVRAIARDDRRVRCVQRVGRRGLSSACIEGMLASAAPLIAVMDADLQHDERLLPHMLREFSETSVDVVIGSRYAEGGGVGTWSEERVSISKFATRLAHLILPKDVKDPMSGFFMMRREVIHQTADRLSAVGFKILVDLIASSPTPPRIKELPYEFRERHAGESKLDSRAAWDFVMLLVDKLLGHIIPVRFLFFCIIGGFGVIVHFLLLTLTFKGFSMDFTAAQSIATVGAMTANFFLNNVWTYRDMRLRGRQLIRGWVTFCLACSVGALANVGVASYLFSQDFLWASSALVGVVVGAVWNYAVTSLYTWEAKRT